MLSPQSAIPFRRVVTCLVLGIVGMSLALLYPLWADASGQAFVTGKLMLFKFPVFLLLELLAILVVVRGIQISNATRKRVIFLRDERLIITALIINYLALILACGFIFALIILPFSGFAV
ncbi:MAG TPA: hypothetical protein VH593_32100 [Ktedonobacteraceae bacterium]